MNIYEIWLILEDLVIFAWLILGLYYIILIAFGSNI